VKLTILMYHKIDELTPGVRFPGNYISPAAFERQMDALVDWGYRTIDIGQWLAYRGDRHASLPDKPLIVTFDDGYSCFARNAWPVLRARQMGAMMFLVAGQIGGTNAWDRDEREERLLDQATIRALQLEGVVFGSHSVSHVPLARIPELEAFDELMRSRAMLGAVLGGLPEVVAYPYSNQSRAVRKLARRAGYRAGFRGKGRLSSRWTDALGLYRIKPEPEWTIADLARRLEQSRWFP
jgi:peptidoglycan/xylan/chitin deacetylase (PgdA/CDA1 family)